MISRRTLVIYNFGLALLFLFVGSVGILALEAANRPAAVPPFDKASQVAIVEESDMERLRSPTPTRTCTSAHSGRCSSSPPSSSPSAG
jgi:hypothetical protein